MSLEEFVLKNQGLLVGIASRYAKKVVDFGIEFDDLYQVGALELVERYKDYCSEKGSVSVFSYWVIRTAILNYIRDHRGITHFSASLSHLSSALSKKNSSFYQETGRYMTEEEMIFSRILYRCVSLHSGNAASASAVPAALSFVSFFFSGSLFSSFNPALRPFFRPEKPACIYIEKGQTTSSVIVPHSSLLFY